MPEYSSDITVKLVRAMAADDYVVQAAQVSAKGENNPNTVPERLIASLMTHRHGSPFEHGCFTFFIEAPIFVIREWQRHRMSSFNEMSGRYTTLQPKFYLPSINRPTLNTGSSMQPHMVCDESHKDLILESTVMVTTKAWNTYQDKLKAGVANEVARMDLPLSIYSQMYWTVNPRSLMNFLSLRVESDESLVKSYPQREINYGADKVEEIFSELMPITHKCFVDNGRVAP